MADTSWLDNAPTAGKDTSWLDNAPSAERDKRPPGLFNKALGAISGTPDDPSILERVGQMVGGTPTTLYGEAVRWAGSHLMSALPGRGDYETERRRLATSEGMPDPASNREGYLAEGQKRWEAEMPYMGIGVHAGLNVGKAGLTSAVGLKGKPMFQRMADAMDRSSARYMTRSLHASDPNIQNMREHLSTHGGDVALDAGRVVRDLTVPTTGQQVVPAISHARTQNTRADRKSVV